MLSLPLPFLKPAWVSGSIFFVSISFLILSFSVIAYILYTVLPSRSDLQKQKQLRRVSFSCILLLKNVQLVVPLPSSSAPLLFFSAIAEISLLLLLLLLLLLSSFILLIAIEFSRREFYTRFRRISFWILTIPTIFRKFIYNNL